MSLDAFCGLTVTPEGLAFVSSNLNNRYKHILLLMGWLSAVVSVGAVVGFSRALTLMLFTLLVVLG